MRYREVRPIIRRGSVREFFGGDPALKGCWALRGNAIDESGNANHGTVTLATPYNWKFNEGYYFSGAEPPSKAYINCGNNASLDPATGDFTCMFWVSKLMNITNNNLKYIVSKGVYPTTARFVFSCNLSAVYSLDFFIQKATGEIKYWTIPNAVNSGKTYFVTGTCKDGGIYFYINGNPAGTYFQNISGVLDLTNTNNFYIATFDTLTSGGAAPQCYLAEIAFLKRALSPAEISQYYQWAIATPRKYWFYSPEVPATGGLLIHPSRDDGYNRRIHGGYIR